MISRADKRRSHRKVGFVRTFLHSVFDAARAMGPQIVKLELGGHKVAPVAVPALWGPESVKLELVLQEDFMSPVQAFPRWSGHKNDAWASRATK